MSKNGKLSKRVWAGMLLFMFMGSLAWNVENMYFNTFLSDMVFNDNTPGVSITLTDAVNIMVTFSAIVAVVTTFIMGTLSEKMKNRKAFISFGYIAWGIVTALFGLISKESVAKFFGLDNAAEVITATAWVVIIMDMVMTFMGSTSNDSAFNAWVTDITTPQTTAKVETAFTFMGFLAAGVIMAIGSLAQGGVVSYNAFFGCLGIFVALVGVIGIFLLDDPNKFKDARRQNVQKNRGTKKKRKTSGKKKSPKEIYVNTAKETVEETSYWSDLFYGLRPGVIKENKNLYLILLSGCTFNCAFQVFFPYLFIYMAEVVYPANEYLDMEFMGKIFTLPSVITIGVISGILAVVSIIVLMKVYNKSKAAAFIPSVMYLVAGLLVLSSTVHVVGIIIGLSAAVVGYVIIMIQFGATVRDNIPQDKVGLFQGVRMIFLVLIPMVVGPTLGNIASKNSNISYMENGVEKMLPTEAMFLYAAVVAALIFVPMLAFLYCDKKKALQEAQSE